LADLLSNQKLKEFLISDAERLGFSDMRITSADQVPLLKDNLLKFVSNQYHGTMDWLKETIDRRSDVKTLWPNVNSIIMLSMSYSPDTDPLGNLENPDVANISVYARHRDYHDLIKGRLKEIAGRLAARSDKDVKVFVDTAPVMEKPLAQKAGLGWQGKHTNLVSRKQGSWFFLGSIFTEAELEPDEAENNHCGTCSACILACPTDAFPAPYKIDARRCISYLTIEHKGPIEHEFREKIGNRIYGCDDCLAACPWNKYAIEANENKLKARSDLISPELEDLLKFDDAAFRTFFSGSPIKRIGRDRFVRNVLIAAGNSKNPKYKEACVKLLNDKNETVRGAAIWALAKLVKKSDLRQLYSQNTNEKDASVLDEWNIALDRDINQAIGQVLKDSK
jgi:epoxyqueuosine reductase